MFSWATGEKLPSCCLLDWSAADCLKLYSHKYLEIRFFNFTLLATIAVSQFHSDREHVDVTKITGKMCKLKAKWCTVRFKCRFVWNLKNHTEFYNNEVTVQLALRIKLLYCYSKCLIYITAVHSIMSRTATFLKNQSEIFPVSFIQMDTNESNIITGIVWR